MLLNVRFGAVLTEGFWVGWCVSVFVYVKESLYHVPWLEGSDSVCSCNANSGLTHTEPHSHCMHNSDIVHTDTNEEAF